MVHDGGDFLQYSAAKVVLDNLIDSREIAETIVAFSHPKDRLVNTPILMSTPASSPTSCCRRWRPSSHFVRNRFGRGLLGASFGAIAALSAAYRYPHRYGSLVLMSGSFVFADAGADHGGGSTLIRW